MNIERKRIERLSTGNGVIGHITLSKLAIPETVTVTLLGEQLVPISFNSYGHPNFTEEQERLFTFKHEELIRQNGGQYIPLEAEIAYEESSFDIPRNVFDTVDGIKSSLKDISTLNEMLQNRRIFLKAHEDCKLNEFILFGNFLLDQFGQVWSIEKSAKGNLTFTSDVDDYKTFATNNTDGFKMTLGGEYAIPPEKAFCHCCGKVFTLDDVKNNSCVSIDGKYYHDSCWRNYRKLIEVDKFTRRMMDLLYKNTDYSFELLPNGYCHQDCCSHIPWFLFHTIHGDIIMGWRKRVISIEWQENYKPFDMNDLFATENVTKWEKAGKRGIHAWSEEKAYEYLQSVLHTVNPGYSRW
ncbi:MAG: hypothetical protein IJX99_01875 [Clostridia bacterium]|nr:hypothetical protein [Clostridia bacterium]